MSLCRALPRLPVAGGIATLALLVQPPGMAFAAGERGTISGTEMGRFGRVVFNFGTELVAKARVVGAVMIVEFDREVAVDLEKLAAQLPTYISVARRDPDGKSIRFGLQERFTPDLKLAGERIYLDLLPARWQGLPPALPPEVIQDLVRRTRAAEERLRQIARDSERKVLRDLDLNVGSTALFKRAIFTMPRVAPVEFSEADGMISILFDANFRIAPELVRAKLAGLVRDVDVEAGETTLRISLRASDGIAVRGFREDDAFTLDFSRPDGKPIELAAAEQPPASQPPAAMAAKPQPAAAAAPAQRAAAPAGMTSDGASIAIKGVQAPDPAIDASFEAGKDQGGFALRLKNLKSAPVAIIPRGNALLVVIETGQVPGMPTIPAGMKEMIESVSVNRVRGGVVMHIVPRQDGAFWLAKAEGDLVVHRSPANSAPDAYAGGAVSFRRAFDKSGKEVLAADVGEAGSLIMIDDPASGQKLAVVPVPEAAHASSNAQNFADFVIERTLSGIAILPVDEAVTVRREPKSVQIGHDIKLNLSALPPEEPVGKRERKALLLDADSWNKDARLIFRIAERERMRSAAESPRANRTEARVSLARLYLAHGYYPEAAGVLGTIGNEDHAAAATKGVIFLRALAATMMGRTVDATRFLVEPALAMEPEQKLLSALVEARLMRYSQANALFKQSMDELERYPDAIQTEFRRAAIDAAIEANDPVFARAQLLAYEQTDPQLRNPHLMQLMAGRIAEGQQLHSDAFDAFSQAMKTPDRRIEAEARFGRAVAGLADGKLTAEEAKSEFETLTAIWRRSEAEVKSLAHLGEMYAQEGRWRDAFLAAQRAASLMPEHPAARKLEDAMSRRFEALFLDKEADKLSKVEALALYQEFRSLIPPGRRGDEIVRRLADRLHDLDLVSEAADILDYQVRNRLEGVARASVATRLAVIHLQNRQAVKALTVLRDTRLAQLPQDLRRARQLLEARALGDLFRTELAVEVLANESGEDVDRLRADIFWKGKKWREAGEAYERVLGESWQGTQALSDGQRLDALRAGLAYVLAEEKLSLDRLRGKFQPKIAKTEDAGAFNLVTVENFTKPQAFREVARSVVNADTMTEFLASYRKRYPESGGVARPVRSAGDQKQSNAGQPVPGNG